MNTNAHSPPSPAARAGGDLPASLVVFLVAVPLSLGIAAGSGAPVMAGLIAAAIGGIVVGLFGGAPLLVSGPAAGLITLVAAAILKLDFGQALAAFALAGVIQTAAGLLKLGRYTLAVPPAVVHGMLAGIGTIIAVQQLRVVLGDSPKGKTLDHLAAIPGLLSSPAWASVGLGLTAFLILVGWGYAPAKWRIVPGALLAVAVPTIASVLLKLDVKRVDLPGSSPQDLLEGFRLPTVPTEWGGVIIAALTIAFIASVESLLSAVATDRLHNGPRANLDKELTAQGLANSLSGMVGGLPITGVIVRSKANIDAGARTSRSAILHGVWIILFVAFLGVAIEAIPLAVLGGLLVHVGMKLVNPSHIKEMIAHGQWPVYAATLAGVVFEDLLIGVAIGFALHLILNARFVGKGRVIAAPGEVRTEGKISNLHVPSLSKKLAALPIEGEARVHLVDEFDHAALTALHDWSEGHRRGGGTPVVVGPGADRFHRLTGKHS